MLTPIGAIIIMVGIMMTFRLRRISKRPRIQVKVDSVSLEHFNRDLKKLAPKQPHAVFKYKYDGKDYEVKSVVNRNVKENDLVELSINPNNPTEIEQLDIPLERRKVLALYIIGIIIFVVSMFVKLNLYDLWS
jgi:uncharacterized protein YxeA